MIRLRPGGTVRVARSAPCVAVCSNQIDRDNDVGTHGATGETGTGFTTLPSTDSDPRATPAEQARHGARRAHRVRNLALAQPDLLARREIGGHRRERQWQFRKLTLNELPVKHIEQAITLDDAASQSDIEQAYDPSSRGRRPGFELLEAPCGKGRSDHRAIDNPPRIRARGPLRKAHAGSRRAPTRAPSRCPVPRRVARAWPSLRDRSRAASRSRKSAEACPGPLLAALVLR